jgi:hypothetical protein
MHVVIHYIKGGCVFLIPISIPIHILASYVHSANPIKGGRANLLICQTTQTFSHLLIVAESLVSTFYGLTHFR